MGRPQSAAIVDVPAPIAEWLVSFGAVKAGATVLDAQNREIRQLRASEWADVQNGKVRAACRPPPPGRRVGRAPKLGA